MEAAEFEGQKSLPRRGGLALPGTALFCAAVVYLGHGWFHGRFLPALGIDARLGDALGSLAIVVLAMAVQRLATLAICRQLFGTVRELRQELASLEHLATTDGLTGCWSRRHLEAILPGEMARLTRPGHATSLLVVDIDHFKNINDTYGHRVGDQVLMELAARLQVSLRASDTLVRWGGEEFVILSTKTSQAAAIAVAERSRALVAQTPFKVAGFVTVSIGVAERRPRETWQAWFDRADAALYAAKSSGRNQTRAAPGPAARGGEADTSPAESARIDWHPAYESGNEAIDAEHRFLFSLANELLNAVVAKRPGGEIRPMVELLVLEIRKHFATEEAMLDEMAYPRLSHHREVHRRLLSRAEGLLASFKSDALEIGELFEFLARDVITRHMLGADRDFFAYVRRASRPSSACSE